MNIHVPSMKNLLSFTDTVVHPSTFPPGPDSVRHSERNPTDRSKANHEADFPFSIS